jgi:hypothetical protein
MPAFRLLARLRRRRPRIHLIPDTGGQVPPYDAYEITIEADGSGRLIYRPGHADEQTWTFDFALPVQDLPAQADTVIGYFSWPEFQMFPRRTVYARAGATRIVFVPGHEAELNWEREFPSSRIGHACCSRL